MFSQCVTSNVCMLNRQEYHSLISKVAVSAGKDRADISFLTLILFQRNVADVGTAALRSG